MPYVIARGAFKSTIEAIACEKEQKACFHAIASDVYFTGSPRNDRRENERRSGEIGGLKDV